MLTERHWDWELKDLGKLILSLPVVQIKTIENSLAIGRSRTLSWIKEVLDTDV